MDGLYLWKYFSRHLAWNEALGLSSGGTPTSRNRLKEGRLLEMKIPLPSLEEQQHIVALANKIEDAIGLQQQAVTRFDVLLSSILDKAFKGEL